MSDTYRWTPSPISGTFEVYAWWVANSKYSKLANYTISHTGASDVVVKGHDANGGAWQLLGTFVFNGSGTEYVQLHAADGKKISADAMRFKQLGGGGGGTITTVDTYFVHSDHLGTPRRVSNDLQTVIWRWDSRPFGDSVPNEDPDANAKMFVLNLRFPGQYFDAESALNYNYFRDYDPSTGRYVESDPIGLGGGLNTYTYVGSNAMRFGDQFGLDVWHCQRPLGDYSGENGRGPPVLNHQFACATQLDGTVRCDSSSNPDDDENPFDFDRPLGAASLPERDNLGTGECEVIENDESRCFEQCVIDRWSQPRPRYAIGPHGTDCQEYTEAIEEECSAICR